MSLHLCRKTPRQQVYPGSASRSGTSDPQPMENRFFLNLLTGLAHRFTGGPRELLGRGTTSMS